MRWWTLGLLGALACKGDGDGASDTGSTNGYGHPAADCVGDHRGTYSGRASGDVFADLQANGDFDLTFTSAFGNLTTSARIGADGLISATGSVFVVSGSYEFLACQGSGTWENATNDDDGNWTISRL